MRRFDSENRIRVQNTKPERPSERTLPLWAKLAIMLFFLFWLSLLFTVPFRQFRFTPAWIFENVRQRFSELYKFLFGSGSSFGITVWQYLAVLLAGAALSACGTVLKSSFQNVLAGPSTMGVMAGGSLGCLIYLLLFTSGEAEIVNTTADLASYARQGFFDLYGRQLFTLLGCLIGVALILGTATAAGRGRLSASAMIVSGSVFSVLVQNISSLIQYYMIVRNPADPRIDAVRALMMGSFDAVTTGKHVLYMAVPILICLAALLRISGKLNLLSLDAMEAASMGLPVRIYRNLVVTLSTVLTAVVVAFCGHIGMLGFMVPLLGRKLAGPDLRRQLPVNLLLGAILLTVIFDAAYVAGMTGYLNLFTSGIGAVVMLTVLLSGKGGRKGYGKAFQN